MSDAKIKFQVEGVQTLKQEMASVLKDVSAQTQLINKSNQDFIKSLQKQIELLKERNKVSSQFSAGALPPSQVNSGTDLSGALRDLNNNLSELIETLRKPQKSSEDSDPVRRQIQAEKGAVSPKMLQTFALANIINPLQDRDPINAGLGVAGNVGSAMMMQGGKAGWAGLAVTAVVGLAKMQTDFLREFQGSASRMARLQGRSVGDYLDINSNPYASIGFTRAEVLNSRANLLRASGRDNRAELSSLLNIQRGFDVSEGELLDAARVGRGDKNFNLNRVFTSLYSGLQYSGLGKEKTEALIPDYLKVLTEIGKDQLSTLGKVDFGINTKLLTVLSGSGERLQNPEVLGSVTRGIIQGLTTAKTPQMEALQYQVLSRAFPGKSLWELEKIREAPLEKGNEKYLPEFLRGLYERSGGNREDFERMISGTTGVKGNIASELAGGFLKGDFELLRQQIPQQITPEDVLKRAMEAADQFKIIGASFENVKVGEFTKSVSDSLKLIVEMMVVSNTLNKTELPGDTLGFQSKLFALVAPYMVKALGK